MKATNKMRTGLPAYPNDIFTFTQMFAIVMTHFNQRVSLGMVTCQHMSSAQMGQVKTAVDAMYRATKLVAYGDDNILGMEMLAAQIDCQQAIEDGCRYEFNMASAKHVVHHEMYLHFLKVAVEVVDLVTAWINTKDNNASKRRLAEIAQLMAQCFILFKFAHVSSDYVDQGTMMRIMPLLRFQETNVEQLDRSIEEDKRHSELQHKVSDTALQESRKLYIFHYTMWMHPLKSTLDQVYMREIAKYN